MKSCVEIRYVHKESRNGRFFFFQRIFNLRFGSRVGLVSNCHGSNIEDQKQAMENECRLDMPENITCE